ncbi:class II D-tagatose-bisphosphate aldolase non-catalytic subunit, partial [Aeromonas hydrophila]|uniref:class II D-tagatose-bisphosphate aldolase non-catalytic subunit n=1 Tax=Aeromonas hydrophila TaxID=644 RepID=UPI0036DDDD19
ARGYSYSDHIRYYWPDSRVDECYARLLANLAAEPIPLPLLSQHLPLQYRKVRQGTLSANPHDLILDQVQEVLRHYASACTAASRRHSQLDPVV